MVLRHDADPGIEYPPFDLRDRVEKLHAACSRQLWAVAYGVCLDADRAMESVQGAFARLATIRWSEWPVDELTWLRGEVLGSLTGDDLPFNPSLRAEPPLFSMIREMLPDLSPADRQAVTLRFALDTAPALIARLLDRTEAEVMQALASARELLGAQLAALPLVDEAA